MGDAQNPYYESFVKSDEWTLLGMYLFRVEMLGRKYREICQTWYQGKLDARALLSFYSYADEYFYFAEDNIKHHLDEKEYEALRACFQELDGGRPPSLSIAQARVVYRQFQKFGWKSGLLKLQSQRPVGKFGKIYSELGLERNSAERLGGVPQ